VLGFVIHATVRLELAVQIAVYDHLMDEDGYEPGEPARSISRIISLLPVCAFNGPHACIHSTTECDRRLHTSAH